MIFALDIETIPNPDTFAFLPEPKASGTLKDPAKIAANIAEKKVAQVEKAALDPLTGRVACAAFVGAGDEGEFEIVEIINAPTDAEETRVINRIMQALGTDGVRIVTWNGAGFDLPFIYKRAMILGIHPAASNAPPLSAWTKRYVADRHYDLMKIWSNWASGADGYVALDTVAAMVLGERKTPFDVTLIADLLATEEGRDKVANYCTQDTRLTWRLWQRMDGTLFA